MLKHFNITVTGKVQGVFFRQSTKQMAELLGLKGFVRNEANGSVYIEAEGDDDLLIKFTHWCHRGPANAQVVSVSITEGELKNFTGFEVQR